VRHDVSSAQNAPEIRSEVLRHRLGEVAARGRDSPDHGDGANALLAVGAEDDRPSRALVEVGDPGGQVGGVAFLAGHLLQAAGDLAQGLAPAGGGVGHHGHVVAHVAVVLGHGDAGVDRGLAGRHRHVGCVGDEDGALHQRQARTDVLQRGELGEDLGHLVAALAAAHVYDDVGLRPFRQRLLGEVLPVPKPPGMMPVPALGHGEESVEDAACR